MAPCQGTSTKSAGILRVSIPQAIMGQYNPRHRHFPSVSRGIKWPSLACGFSRQRGADLPRRSKHLGARRHKPSVEPADKHAREAVSFHWTTNVQIRLLGSACDMPHAGSWAWRCDICTNNVLPSKVIITAVPLLCSCATWQRSRQCGSAYTRDSCSRRSTLVCLDVWLIWDWTLSFRMFTDCCGWRRSLFYCCFCMSELGGVLCPCSEWRCISGVVCRCQVKNDVDVTSFESEQLVNNEDCL